MKNQTFPIIALLLFPWVANSQTASFFGAPGKNDVAHKIITTSDGSYLVAGQVDNDASLYKFDCQGQLVDSLRFDLGAPLSYEHFFDVLELPNGQFLAVGAADVLFAEPAVDMVVAVRVNAEQNPMVLWYGTTPATKPSKTSWDAPTSATPLIHRVIISINGSMQGNRLPVLPA